MVIEFLTKFDCYEKSPSATIAQKAVPKFSWKLSKVSKAVSCSLLKFTKSSGYLRYFDSDIKNNRKCKTLLY